MNFRIKTIALAAVLVLATLAVQAQKFGYVNSMMLLQDLPEMKAIEADLKGFQTTLQKDGEAKVQAFQKKVQAAEQKKQQGLMTPKEEETVSADLQKEQEALMQLEQEMGQRISQKQQELMKPVLDRVDKAIKDVAKEQGFQFIFDQQTGVIVYADATTDVTELVKAKLKG